MSLLRAMTTVGGLTGVSRLAGFVRDIIAASILGAGPIADAFFVALKLPNFFRRVTGEGAFSVSFVPLYAQALEQEGREAADRFAGNAIVVMFGVLSVFCILVMLLMPYIMFAIAPGFVGGSVRFDLAVELSRITFPYLLFISLTALLGGVMNALGRFAPFAFAPVIFNMAQVVFLLMSGLFESAGHALAWGIFTAGILQLIWLWLCVRRSNFRFIWSRPIIDDKVKAVFRLMGPGLLGAGVMHINLFADMMMASFLKEGSISYLYYADRLNQLPLGMVGIAVGTALLPLLSRAMSRGDHTEARDLFNRAFEYCLLLALPAAVALMIIPYPIITTLFERGAFTHNDSIETSWVLAGYAIGLPAYITTKVFSTAHWARQDTATPVRIAIVGIVVNIGLSLILIQFIGVAGIAFSTGISGWVQYVMHLRALKDHPSAHFDEAFKKRARGIILSSVAMALILALSMFALQDFFGGDTLHKLLALSLIMGAGGIVYFGLIFGLRVIDLAEIKKFIARKRDARKV
jgi:putative peptidoglycan lipid II flippase